VVRKKTPMGWEFPVSSDTPPIRDERGDYSHLAQTLRLAHSA